ncbi:MAG TPA: hypothetical protein VFM01_08410 [Nakamurella sp.]|nr:hypothetical protein [Nakamurella sp.]
MGRHAERSSGARRPGAARAAEATDRPPVTGPEGGTAGSPAFTGRGGGRERGRFATIAPVLAICLLVIGALVLGIWWWNVRSVTDPIDADPVDAYAQVVSSPACSAGGQTLVRISGTEPPVTATLSGCGFARDQRLAVQYLAGHPDQVRLTGSSVAGAQSLAGRLLPIGILAAGLVAVLATVALLVDRRRSRHAPTASRVTVAQLRSRARPHSDPATPGWSAGATERPPTPDGTGGAAGSPTAGGSSAAAAGRAPAPAPDGHATAEPTEVTARPDPDHADLNVVLIDPARVDGTEPAHLFPSGFVMIDEQLFTHSGPEAGGERPPD